VVKQKISAYKISETKDMQRLIGKTVKDVFYDDKNDINQVIEGVYGIIFTDGTQVTFSSSGDDATTTYMTIEEKS
jgi:hypothetical protein